MKLKYIIPSFMAVVAAVFTGCSDDNDPTYLSEARVSQSIVALNAAGDEKTIEVTTTADWAFAKDFQIINGTDTTYEAAPAWLTVSPQSGSAGTTTVTLKAPSTTESYDIVLRLLCADKTQRIQVIQQAEKVELPITPIKDVLAGPDATYRVRGVCVTDPDNQYGNWYIEDETGRVYIYGTNDRKGNKGAKPISGDNGWDFGVGDIITVEGPRTLYGSTVELVDVTVISIEKSLIKVDSLSTDELPMEGGDVVAYLTNKGNGITIDIPEAAKSWLSVTGIQNSGTASTVKLHAAENTGGDRSATLVFKTTDAAGKEYTSETTVTQKGAIIECSVADFNAAEVGDTQYRLTGVISKVANASYGNYYIKDFSGETYVYGTGNKGDFEAMGLKDGDIVTVVGKRAEYKGTIEMTNSTIENIIPVTPVSIAEFLTKPDDKNTWYMVTGTISSLLGSNGKENDYGNLYITDGTNELYVYGTYPGWGATGDYRKFFIANNGIEVGDEITIIGYKDTYKELVELCGGVCFSFKKAGADGE